MIKTAIEQLGAGVYLAGCVDGPCTNPAGFIDSGGKYVNSVYGKYCYRPTQKRDNDQTDIIAACYCEGRKNVLVCS